jgi:hypothetical protein
MYDRGPCQLQKEKEYAFLVGWFRITRCIVYFPCSEQFALVCADDDEEAQDGEGPHRHRH